MNDPSDMSIGSPEDYSHLMEIDKLHEKLDRIKDALPPVDLLDTGEWNEYTGNLLLSEDAWAQLKEGLLTVKELLK